MGLKEIMEQRKITQAQLSRMAGINQTQLNRACNGHQKFFPSWKKRIAKTLDLPEIELFPDEGRE